MQHLLAQLVAGRPLTLDQALEAFDLIMTGRPTPAQVGALLALIQLRGPTEDEIVGAATVMRQKATPVDVPPGLMVIDTCGTGGTHSRSFNISTAAGLVAAAVGRPRKVVVAKHGNRAVTSASGSSQVLAALGVKLQVSPATLTRCLDEAGFCFCFAPAHHPAMRFAAPIRADLGFRTIFNLLGPLTNPAGAKRQLMGVSALDLTEPIARVLLRLGSERALVVHGRMGYGEGEKESRKEEKQESRKAGKQEIEPSQMGGGSEVRGLGELTTTGPTRVSQVSDGRVRTYELDARELGLPAADPRDLQVDSPEASAALIRRVLKADAAAMPKMGTNPVSGAGLGTPSPGGLAAATLSRGERGPEATARDIVCLNAAAALVVAGLAADLPDGLVQARAVIDSGAAAAVLEKLIRVTQADVTPP